MRAFLFVCCDSQEDPNYKSCFLISEHHPLLLFCLGIFFNGKF